MDLVNEISRFDLSKIFNSASICSYFPSKAENASPSKDNNKLLSFQAREAGMAAEAEGSVIESIWQDDKGRLISYATLLSPKDSAEPLDRCIVSALLRFCCTLDSVECAAALINGELGAVPLLNEMDETGRSVLHVAAEMQAARCVELLLRKRARTDLKTKDGRAQLALELSLSSLRMEVTWSPDESSIEDLIVLLSEKDLTALRLLSEKTKETAEVAYANAIGGCMVSLAALLIVATEKVNESILELRDGDSGTKEKTTVYECVIREALALGRGELTPSIAAKQNSAPTQTEIAEKRKLLLREIELLQLFGAVAQSVSPDKKMTPPLIRAAQAGDETIVQMLLKTNIDVNDTDAEGNSALHWSLKASKSSSPQQMKIMNLLLRHGARVNQKNMLGLTAVHIAAANGNSEALQVLLWEDPDTVNYKTETKETPLFFAVKNDHIDCVELLLQRGANSQVLNLRRQRSIDLASSQDMRFMLNPININLMNRSIPVQRKHTAWLQGDEVISETSDSLVAMTYEGTHTERNGSNAKTEICKYYDSHAGCIRGSKCSYAHGEEELRRLNNLGKRLSTHSIAAQESKRRIFVGGLPISLDSDSMAKFFDEEFGPVEEAIVVGAQAGDHIQSRGFGFVTFKHEKSVSAAVQAHYVTIMGKQVEIKSVVPKCLLGSQFQKLSPQQEKSEQNEQYQPQMQYQKLSFEQEKCEQNDQHQPQAQLQNLSPQQETYEPNEQHQSQTGVQTEKNAEEAKPEPKSWADRLLQGQQAQANTVLSNRNMPAWLRTFKKWFPGFLKKVSERREEDYPLSSLKADFRATFGVELDHASLGYTKLSDFMRSLPGCCQMKIVPVGRRGPATHIILLPNLPIAHSQPLQITKPNMSSCAATIPIDNKSDGDSNGSKCLPDSISVSSENLGVTSSGTEEGNTSCEIDGVYSAQNMSSDEVVGVNPAQNNHDPSPSLCQRLLDFLKPDLLFHSRPWLSSRNGDREDSNDQMGWIEGVKGMKLMYQQRHLVLEALSRNWSNPSIYFLREFDFYHKYKACVKRGLCFGCNQQRMIFANSPCQHFLWCNDCKLQAIRAAGFFEHKCVVCDMKVQSIDFIPWPDYSQGTCHDLPNGNQLLPFSPYHTISPSEKRAFPLVGY